MASPAAMTMSTLLFAVTIATLPLSLLRYPIAFGDGGAN